MTNDELFNSLLERFENEEDKKIILDAYNYAKEIYGDEIRLNKESLLSHAVNVAIITHDICPDTSAIASGLLHETLKKGTITRNDIKERFGEEIAFLVESVDKLNKISLNSSSDAIIMSERNILVGLAEDFRVIVIKLADRLHNMRTLYAISETSQKEKARETLEVLAPIAHRLGIHTIKSELEDLSLMYYKPEVYKDIVDTLNSTKNERNELVEKMKYEISSMLDEHGIKHEIKGRAKSIYSIYKKLSKGKTFSSIYDLLALRVFVDKEEECYKVLGLIHSKFKPIPKRFKDYIAMPKSNMYQSLHTTVLGFDGKIFEIQIRTYEMDEIAENGIAAHWAYKEGGSGTKAVKTAVEQKLLFFKSIMELNEEKKDDYDFVNAVKEQMMSSDSIYVYTPKGDVFELPSGSTPIDFAYRVHTEVGNKMVGAIVNDNIVPLDYKLNSGDIVKINTNKNSKGPSYEWINMAATVSARDKIKSFFSKIDKKEYIKNGEELLQNAIRKKKMDFQTFYGDEILNKVFNEYKISSKDELYFDIGSGKLNATAILNFVTDESVSKEEEIVNRILNGTSKEIEITSDIIVPGIDKIKTQLASCCTPIKGDEIIGYISKGKGITVHRRKCHNIENNERVIDVFWNDSINKKFPTTILIHAEYNDKLLLDIINKSSLDNVSVEGINVLSKGSVYIYQAEIMVTDTDTLRKYIDDLYLIPNIRKVERIIK